MPTNDNKSQEPKRRCIDTSHEPPTRRSSRKNKGNRMSTVLLNETLVWEEVMEEYSLKESDVILLEKNFLSNAGYQKNEKAIFEKFGLHTSSY